MAFFPATLPALAQTALPGAPIVAAGTAAISSPSATSTLVNQSSQNAIINWGSFSVGAGNSVRFENGSGATLNRVTGFSASQIDGSLSASGSLFLVNPNGVAIGPNGSVVTGGSFVASTHDVGDSEFMAGGAMTFRGSSTASVINYGSIGSLGGDVALIARKVENAGTITAPNGTVALAAGYEVLMRDGALSDGKFVVKVGGADTEAKTSGIIKAAEIELKANGGNVYALAGNTGSLTKATGVATKGGRVFLTAGTGGTVTVTQKVSAKGASGKGGSIKASGAKVKIAGTLDAAGATGAGGAIVVEGSDIGLTGTAVLDASGTTGGLVLVGGDYQGGKDAAHNYLSEAVATAQTTTVEAGARIDASGTAGAGGHVVVWSDAQTSFAGSIVATGAGTGAGGDAEVSGKAQLAFTGTADLTSAGGVFGTLLLDPYNLTISSASSSGMSGFNANGNDSVLNVTTLTNALATANVTVTTGSSGSQSGTITVADAVTWSSGSKLTLSAYGNIAVNANLAGGTGSSIVLYADNTGTGSGTVSFGSGVTATASGGVSIFYNPTSYSSATDYSGNAGADTTITAYMLVNGLDNLQAISTNLAGMYALGRDIDAYDTSGWNDGAGFAPIGDSSNPFTGTLDGQNHTIYGLTINRSSNYNGLFGYAGTSAVFRDLTLSDGNISGSTFYSGSLVAYNKGTITNVTSSLSVSAANIAGGLVGYNDGGSITGSSASGRVTGWTSGGLVGFNSGTISDSSASGEVGESTDNGTGGLVGQNSGTLTNVQAYGNVNGNSPAGGLVGVMDSGSITNASATGDVTAYWAAAGGLVGQMWGGSISGSTASGSVTLNSITSTALGGGLVGDAYGGTIATSSASGNVVVTASSTAMAGGLVGGALSGAMTITESFASGDVTAVAASTAAGGLVGPSDAAIDASYATGNVSGKDYVGGLVGVSRGTITSSYATGNVAGTGDYVGGLAGSVSGTVSQVYATGDVSGHEYVGGLAGDVAGTGRISYAYATGNVTADSTAGGLVGLNSGGSAGIWDSFATGSVSGGDYVGGIAGNSQATIIRSYATGAVSGRSYVGGLAGVTGETISETYATGAVTATGNYVGGLIGLNGLFVSTSYATGAVTGGSYTGGLVGGNFGLVQNSYALGSVTGTTNVGGLVGANWDATIDMTYATGAVTGTSNVGGLVGMNTEWAIVTSSYWDTETTGQSHSAGSDDSYGLTTEQARQSGSYSGWDFNTVWYQAGDMRPILRAEAASAVDGVITVNNLHQLALIATDLSGSYVLGSSIDATATNGSNAAGIWGTGGFVPIGNNDERFVGSLDGQGHVISGLTINRPDTDYVGLFGYVANAHSVTNLGLIGGSVTGRDYVGGLVGQLNGTLTNVYATDSVTGRGNVGGLVGLSGPTSIVSDAYATGAVSGESIVGGLIGFSRGSVSYAYATGSVSASGSIGGGLIGINTGSVSNAYASGAVSGGDLLAGFIGSNDGDVTSSFWDKESSGQTSWMGEGLDGDVTGLTTAQARSASSYTGWDFSSVWYQAGDMRPILRSEAGSAVDGVITVNNLHQLALIGANLSGSHVLATDIDASATAGSNAADIWGTGGFVPIGGSAQQFSGSFDGQGHVISGLTINRPDTDYVGLFGYVANGSSVTNVGLVGGSVTGRDYVGALVGRLNGTLTNIYATGDVTGRNQVGGLVGRAASSASISSAYASGAVSGTYYIGGLAGYSDARVSNAYATGSASGSNIVGGFMGFNGGRVSKAYSSGAVSATSGLAAGFIGSNDGTVSASFWDKETSGQTNGIGEGNDGEVTGLTTAEFQDTSGFMALASSAGWDFSTVWVPSSDGYYPELYALSPVVWVNAVATSSTYGDSTAAVTSVSSVRGADSYVFGSGDSLALTGGTVAIDATTNAGTQTTTLASQNSFVTSANGVTYRVFYYGNQTATVTPAALTVTADNGTMVYGDTASSIGYTATGWKNGQTASLLSGVNVTANATSTSNVGSSYVTTAAGGTLSGAASGNYTISYVQGSFSLTPATLTVTADNGTMAYGDSVPTVGYTTSGWKNSQTGSLLSGVNVTTNATSTSNVGSYITTAAAGTLSGAASGNYTISYAQGSVSVTPRLVTVTADNQSMTAGNAVPPLTYALSSGNLVNGDAFSGELTTSATSRSAAGLYSILQGTLGLSANYSMTYVPGELTVTGSETPVVILPPTPSIPSAPPAPEVARTGTLTTANIFIPIAENGGQPQQTGSSRGGEGETSTSCVSGTACANQPYRDNRSFGRWLSFRTP